MDATRICLLNRSKIEARVLHLRGLHYSLVAEKSESRSVVSDSCDSMDCSLSGSLVHVDTPGKITGVGCHFPSPGNLPNPGVEPRSPEMQAVSLPTELQGKPSWTVYSVELSRPEYWSARILEWVAFPFSRESSQPRNGTQVSRIAGGTLPAESQRKPKNTGVGGLSLLQRIFLTQESKLSLLHCRQILYQLSYEGSPQRKQILIKSYNTYIINYQSA